MDATLIAASVKRPPYGDGGLNRRDPDARVTMKRRFLAARSVPRLLASLVNKTLWRCATFETEPPRSRVSAIIGRFSSLDQNRRPRGPPSSEDPVDGPGCIDSAHDR